MHRFVAQRTGLTSLGRRVAHRWSALVGAGLVSVLLPAGAAFAAFGPTIFTAGLGATAVTATGPTGVDATGDFVGVIARTSGGVGLRADAENGRAVNARSQNGIAVDAASKAQTAIQARATTGRAIDARSETSIGLEVEAGNTTGLHQATTPGEAISARGERFGMHAVGGDTGVIVEGTRNGVIATGVGAGAPGVFARSGDGGSGVIASGTGQFANGVSAQGTFAGVQAQGGDTGVTASGGEYGASFSGNTAPLRLRAASTQGAPKSGLHRQGELYIDNQGHLFLCLADGTPGTWKEVVLK